MIAANVVGSQTLYKTTQMIKSNLNQRPLYEPQREAKNHDRKWLAYKFMARSFCHIR